MKEFSAQTGGRYTYVDDIVNLQELSLAFASIFNGCDNFIISGCEISGTSISEGYVYINGKIRYFSGVSGITTWPQYLYESNRTETVAYASGSDKVGRNIYGCAIAAAVPTALDPLTNSTPAFIQLTSAGGLTINDALFGKYALLLQSKAGQQTVNDVVTFNNDVNVNGALTTKGRTSLKQGNAVCQMYYNGENLVVQSQIASGAAYRFVITNGTGFQFYVNDTLLYTISNQGIATSLPITMKECMAGNISVTGNDIVNKGHASNTACININMTGYAGGTEYYRDTFIGNGKGSAIIAITGSSSVVQINGRVNIKSSTVQALILQCSHSKDNVALRKTIVWSDSNNDHIAYIGYNQTANNLFEIKNTVANIAITGYDAVDLGPAIKENGVLLSTKYALVANMTKALGLKADSSTVYTTTQADTKFAAKNGGFTQFVGPYTKAQLRTQIEAMSASDVANLHPTKANLLSDMATSEEKKAQIRQNIGAAKEGTYQSKLSDTGWVTVSGNIKARQIGNIVCIQGQVYTYHSGTIFTLPNSIDAPKYDVAFSTATDHNSPWTCRIAGGQKKCTIVYCSGACDKTISFSMTYMV